MPPRPTIPLDDLYARLEVPPEATAEAIEIAWRALLKRHHPDVAGSDALEVAKRINVAHDWLSDPDMRARYDRERGVGIVRHRRAGPTDPPVRHRPPARSVRRPARDPADALRRFVEHVGRLSRDELDRLSVAETSSIAFVASIRRFLAPPQAAALDRTEAEIRSRLPPAAWANPATRDAILAAAHELVLAPFLDEHLTEPFRGRARERLMRGWEAAVDQPRYGPNTLAVERFVARVGRLDARAVRSLVHATGPVRVGHEPWPPGLDPEEDETLRVSSALAGRDAVTAGSALLATFDRDTAAAAAGALARTAHALVLRHAFPAETFRALIAPWTAATEDPDPVAGDQRPEPRVRRR